jgi:hypothetical protein
MLKDSPEKVFEYLGMPAPKRLTGEDKQTHKAIIAALLAKAMSGKTDAINVVLERIEGKAVQPMEMIGDDQGNLVDAMDLPLELRVEVLRNMLADAERELAIQRDQEMKVVNAKEDIDVKAVVDGKRAQSGDEGLPGLGEIGVVPDSGQDAGADFEAGEVVTEPEV